MSTSKRAVMWVTVAMLGGCSNNPTQDSSRPGDARPDSSGTGGTTPAPPASGTGGSSTTGDGSGGGGGLLADAGGAEPSESTDGTVATTDAHPDGHGYGGVAGLEDLSTIKKSPGCGMTAPQTDTDWHAYNVTTPMTRMGSLMRTYHLKLPPNYDNNKPYRLIFQGTNCGGCATCVMPFDTIVGTEGVIQVALERKSGTNCFDDQSPMSIDYPFAEAADGDLRQKICFDEHRVFFNGHSSGSWLTNEAGCIYASAPQAGPAPPGGPLVVRAIAPHSGGLPATTPCSDRPMPGMWTHNHDDPLNTFMGSVNAINRALKVNGCMGSYGNSPTAPYAAPGTNNTCHIFTSCPKEFPIIFCDPATGGHEGNKFYEANWQFFMSF